METTTESSFGDKLFEAQCKVSIPPQPLVEALAEVWSMGLCIKPASGNAIFLPYTEARKIETANYRASVTTSKDATPSVVELSQFGTKYDRFAQALMTCWGDALAKALLMHELMQVYEASGFYSQISTQSHDSQASDQSQCRARIYETALVILPINGLPRRIPFTFIRAVDLESYKVKISTVFGIVELSRLGNSTQFFIDKLREAMRNIESSCIETIKYMLPSALLKNSES